MTWTKSSLINIEVLNQKEMISNLERKLTGLVSEKSSVWNWMTSLWGKTRNICIEVNLSLCQYMTMACDDKQKIPAHKVILSASSPDFRSYWKINNNIEGNHIEGTSHPCNHYRKHSSQEPLNSHISRRTVFVVLQVIRYCETIVTLPTRIRCLFCEWQFVFLQIEGKSFHMAEKHAL